MILDSVTLNEGDALWADAVRSESAKTVPTSRTSAAKGMRLFVSLDVMVVCLPISL